MIASFESHRFDFVYIFVLTRRYSSLQAKQGLIFNSEIKTLFESFAYLAKVFRRNSVQKTRNSMELTSLRREQGRRC